MEVQLREIIDQIKKEGVDTAEKQAEEIISSAKERAEKIISDAKAEADKILLNAKAENERAVRSGEEAIRQAGRNLLISFRESIARELKAIVSEGVSEAYSSQDFARIIACAVQSFAEKSDTEAITLILSCEDLKKLESTLRSALRERMLDGVNLKTDDSLSGGFHISVKDGSYYDYSAEAVTDMLADYLSPEIIRLLKEAE